MLVATDYLVVEMPRGNLKPTSDSNAHVVARLQHKPPLYVLAAHGEEFLTTGRISHGVTCFLLDIGHDWTWSDGVFRLCVEAESVVLVFAVDDVRFCGQCGVKGLVCGHAQ